MWQMEHKLKGYSFFFLFFFFLEELKFLKKKKMCNNLELKSIWTIIYLWQKYNFGVTVNLVTTLSNSQFGLCYSNITVNFQSIFVSKLTIRTKLTTSWKNNINQINCYKNIEKKGYFCLKVFEFESFFLFFLEGKFEFESWKLNWNN